MCATAPTKFVFVQHLSKWEMKGYFCVEKAPTVFVPKLGYTQGLVSNKTENTSLTENMS